MFDTGDVIGDRFEVLRERLPTSGGMGEVVFVRDLADAAAGKLVLKACKRSDAKSLKRFSREVRILATFSENSRIIQIIAFDAAHVPPYYVMKYFADGDLASHQKQIASNTAMQEDLFCQMIDCIQELHSRGIMHRDIKPQNFLLDGTHVVAMDMGLSIECDSDTTALTSTAEILGTYGYMPPEYALHGLKEPAPSGDVFMLGKTFYYLLTGRPPAYMTADDMHPGVYHVIKRACENDKKVRYQTLAELKQALVQAYDMVAGRMDGATLCRSELQTILHQLQSKRTFVTRDVKRLLNSVAQLPPRECDEILMDFTEELFSVIAQAPFADVLGGFLDTYSGFVKRNAYSWQFAETIADCMWTVVQSSSPKLAEKARAIELAIAAAVQMNRFAAMDTCRNMITTIYENALAEHVAPIVLACAGTFVARIEPATCKSHILAQAVRSIAKKD